MVLLVKAVALKASAGEKNARRHTTTHERSHTSAEVCRRLEPNNACVQTPQRARSCEPCSPASACACKNSASKQTRKNATSTTELRCYRQFCYAHCSLLSWVLNKSIYGDFACSSSILCISKAYYCCACGLYSGSKMAI